MNYEQSKAILDKVQSSERILLNCHRGPDPDSVGSATALCQTLKSMGKEVEIVCPSREKPEYLNFLPEFRKIKFGIDFSKFKWDRWNLFIALDSSSWEMVADIREGWEPPDIDVVVIDHHKTNTRYGSVNLVDDSVTSVGELLFLVLKDWNVKLNKEIATSLLTGVIGDTGAFRYPGAGARTLKVGGELIGLGADKDDIVFHIYQSTDFELIKFWGEVIKRAKLDREGNFFWSAVPYSIYKKYMKKEGRETSSSMFAQIIDGTKFGFVAIEQEKEKLSISLRSRTGFDTSKIAIELGGGGHIYASGCSIKGMDFDSAVKKLLKVARKHAKQEVEEK